VKASKRNSIGPIGEFSRAGEIIDESALRHSHERLIFIGIVVLNFLLVGAAVSSNYARRGSSTNLDNEKGA
jgi:hypothetical protein